jgi:hypothetical protein
MAAPIGNKFTQKWEYEDVLSRFEKSLENVLSDSDFLSIQYFIIDTGIPPTTFEYMVDKYDVLGDIKEMVKTVVIARINKKALKNECNATAAIWRFKQLGEKDERTNNNNNVETLTVSVD